MADSEDRLPDEEERFRQLLSHLSESAAKREALLPEETELILSMAAALKSSGLSAAELLTKMASAEEQLRMLLGISESDSRWPPIGTLAPLLAGSRFLCDWPGSDFIYAPSVLNWLAFLRQQNDPWVGAGNTIARPIPENPESMFWSEDAQNALWRTRLLVGANRATETRYAPRKDLDRMAEALRFNKRRSGRRNQRTVAFMVEKQVYLFYCAFHGILKKGQRETPRGHRDEPSIGAFLQGLSYPRFLVGRLAQELCDHRQRRRGPGARLTLQDRAALMVGELEGRRGEYGLPEPLGTEELLEEDTSQPPSVATRRPLTGPFATLSVEKRYVRLQMKALRWARGRVRQTKAIWNSGFVVQNPNKK
jgi:hypothetical protein